ncbi:hypothetical protein RD00_13925 [Pseudomonas amygdali pv. tabaci]|nr:hypothetical protein RD00_13925 [Pseudomonas amygdali pv. tabaci]
MNLSSISTAPVLMAALALVGGYGDAVSTQKAASHDDERRHEVSQQNEKLAADIHNLVKSFNNMESEFGRIIKGLMAVDLSSLPDHMDAPETLNDLGFLLESVRGMEITLRSIEVPDGLHPLHMNFRRALARARESISVLYSLTSQTMTIPADVDSGINPEGLKALAEHSTKRLIELAKA